MLQNRTQYRPAWDTSRLCHVPSLSRWNPHGLEEHVCEVQLICYSRTSSRCAVQRSKSSVRSQEHEIAQHPSNSGSSLLLLQLPLLLQPELASLACYGYLIPFWAYVTHKWNHQVCICALPFLAACVTLFLFTCPAPCTSCHRPLILSWLRIQVMQLRIQVILGPGVLVAERYWTCPLHHHLGFQGRMRASSPSTGSQAEQYP